MALDAVFPTDDDPFGLFTNSKPVRHTRIKLDGEEHEAEKNNGK